jgi:hypothetical protein
MDQMGSEDTKNGREEKYFKYFIRSLSRWRTLKCDSRLGRLLNDETAVGGGLKGKKWIEIAITSNCSFWKTTKYRSSLRSVQGKNSVNVQSQSSVIFRKTNLSQSFYLPFFFATAFEGYYSTFVELLIHFNSPELKRFSRASNFRLVFKKDE